MEPKVNARFSTHTLVFFFRRGQGFDFKHGKWVAHYTICLCIDGFYCTCYVARLKLVGTLCSLHWKRWYVNKTDNRCAVIIYVYHVRGGKKSDVFENSRRPTPAMSRFSNTVQKTRVLWTGSQPLLCLTRRIILATKRSTIDCERGKNASLPNGKETNRTPVVGRPVRGIIRVRGVKVFESFVTISRLLARVNS